MWRSLSHSYILPLLGIFEVESQLFLVSPYMKNGTLDVWRGNKQLEPGVDEIRMRVRAYTPYFIIFSLTFR